MAEASDAWARRQLARMDASARTRTERVTEATPQQRWASGASWSGVGYYDPIDATNGRSAAYGFRQFGKGGPFDMPERARQQANIDSIAAYKTNPMARAILDTYVAFCVGDVGVTVQCSSDLVKPIVDQFWTDTRNRFQTGMELMFRTWMLRGEMLQEMMVGELTGVCRRSPIDTSRVRDVRLLDDNPLIAEAVAIAVANSSDPSWVPVIEMDDISGLRQGQAFWWPAWKTLETDTRGTPFLAPIIDWLDSYDTVLSNLIDRTALARYLAWDVTLKGADGDQIDAWIAQRGGRQIPRSGTMEVHNDSVEMNPVTAQTGAFEDVATNAAVMTSIAGGAGLSKHWLAEPDQANRATSMTMAEPVRRRVGSVQNEWMANLTEMNRFAVDKAVEAGLLPMMVDIETAGGGTLTIPTSQTVTVSGPQVAAADSQVMATVLLNLSQAFNGMVADGVLSLDAAQLATQKAWSDYCGVPYRAELDPAEPDEPVEPANVDRLAEHIDDSGGRVPLVAA